MLTERERQHVLKHAYVPEHSPDLIACVSGGDPLLWGDYFCCRTRQRFILVGYPLGGDTAESGLEEAIGGIRRDFRPRALALIAPAIPPSLAARCEESAEDFYFTLDLSGPEPAARLNRAAESARRRLSPERSASMGPQHEDLAREFIARANPPARVRALLAAMPGYLKHSEGALLLNAWERHQLAAFYVADLAPERFSSYVIGCQSRRESARGASDLLLHELIRLSRERGKQYVHLGLGVNDGIRRFKRKWGGLPTRRYEMCEAVLKRPALLEILSALQRNGRRSGA